MAKDDSINKEQLNYISKKLKGSYIKEKKFFRDILHFALVSNIDIDFTVKRKNRGGKTSKECPTRYDGNVLICLVILKWIYNSIKKNSISNRDLILIRGESVVSNFDELGKDISKYIEKYPKLFKMPYDYFKARVLLPLLQTRGKEIFETLPPEQKKGGRKLNDNHKFVIWLKDLGGNDFSYHIDKFPFAYYLKYIDVLLVLCEEDIPQGMTTTTVREGIKAFFHDFKIDEKDGLTYSFIENIYSKSDDSFDRVFHSKQGNGSYKATWNRFLKHYPKETIGKFYKLIGKKKKNIEEYLSGKL